VQIGAGAIGSLTAEILVRKALDHWTTIDPTIAAAQPRAPRSFRDGRRVAQAIGLAHRLGHLRTDLAADAIVADVLNPASTATRLPAPSVRRLVIDAAASVPVARLLCDHEGAARRASIFFNPAGTSLSC